MIKTLIILAIIYALYRLYMRMFQEKQCSSCGKHIPTEDPVCHHCSVVQSSNIVIEADSLDQNIKPPVNLLRSPLVLTLLVLSQVAVFAALYFLLVR